MTQTLSIGLIVGAFSSAKIVFGPTGETTTTASLSFENVAIKTP